MKTIFLNIKNRSGSVEHYYHFLLGFLIPLVDILINVPNEAYVVRSCGPLDSIIRSLPISRIEIVDKFTHEKITRVSENNHEIKLVTLLGFDKTRYFDRSAFDEFNKTIFTLYSNDIGLESKKLSQRPLVVLIKRENHDFYRRGGPSEIPGSGAQRRSILNFPEIEFSIKSIFPMLKTVSLEDTSLPFQVALFKNADIVIAQHGAALANLVFCRPGTKVIEITPFDQKKLFLKLAKCMDLKYCPIHQEDQHGYVDPSELINAFSLL